MSDSIMITLIISAVIGVIALLTAYADKEQRDPDVRQFSKICLEGTEYWHSRGYHKRALALVVKDGAYVSCN